MKTTEEMVDDVMSVTDSMSARELAQTWVKLKDDSDVPKRVYGEICWSHWLLTHPVLKHLHANADHVLVLADRWLRAREEEEVKPLYSMVINGGVDS